MANTAFEQIEQIIKNRRTGKPAAMNGKHIPDEQVESLLQLAHWAPTHGRTEPWYFFVYTGEGLKQFGKAHAELYWNNTAEENRKEETREKLEHNVDMASHLVVAIMKRGENPKIPVIEETAAAAAAVQNMLLGAEALGISAMWNTGGMTLKQAFKDHLQLGAEDTVLGLLFLGYTDEPAREGKRNSAITDKVRWVR